MVQKKSKNVKKSVKKSKKGVWFVRVRGSYLPASPIGWLLYIPFAAYLILALVIAARDESSIGPALLFVVPNWIAAAVIMTWIAVRKS
jgi:membrane-anchored glycerophosphoryl diester phosphodiesterase (GDPDase)